MGAPEPVAAARCCSVGSQFFTFVVTKALNLRCVRYIRDAPTMNPEQVVDQDLRQLLAPELREASSASSLNALRLSPPTAAGSLYLGVFVSFPSASQLLVFEVHGDPTSGLQLKHIATKLGLPDAIADFCLTTTAIWATWTESARNVVVHSPLASPSPETWVQALPHGDESECFPEVPVDRDPREVYSALFKASGPFSRSSVARALQIFGGGGYGGDQLETASAHWDTLAPVVTLAVEAEIRAGNLELSDEQYRQEETRCWTDLIQSCVHYQNLEDAPRGLVVSHDTGMVFLVLESGVVWLRPCEALEALYLHPKRWQFDEVAALPRFISTLEGMPLDVESPWAINQTLEYDNCAASDLCLLLEVIKLVSPSLGHQVTPDFVTDVVRVAEQHATSFMESAGVAHTTDVVRQICCKLNHVHSIAPTARLLIRMLWPRRDDSVDQGLEQRAEEVVGGMFESTAGVAVLASVLEQFVSDRMRLLRDLAVTLQIALLLRTRAGLSAPVCQQIGSLLQPVGEELWPLRCLYWASTCPAVSPDATSDSDGANLASLTLADDPSTANWPRNASVAHAFIRQNLAEAQLIAAGMLAQYVEDEPCHAVASECVTFGIMQMAVTRGGVDFASFLLQANQLFALQEYARLYISLTGPLLHLLGCSQLATAEYVKAKTCFLRAATCLDSPGREEAVALRNLADCSYSKASYFVRVMRLFEAEIPVRLNTLAEDKKPPLYSQHAAVRHTIEFARQALAANEPAAAATPGDVGEISMLWAIVFKYSLSLGDTDGAFSATMRNPDPETRSDSLQRLVGVLCERRDYQAVCQLPFGSLRDGVQDVLLSKARNMDLLASLLDDAPNFYKILYSFHVFAGDYRAAADVMFQFAERLEALSVVDTEDCLLVLTAQRDTLGVALNALRLVSPQNAWLTTVRPAVASDTAGGSSLRTALHPDLFLNAETKLETRLITVDQLELWYCIVDARLSLLRHDAQAAATSLNSLDVVSLLTESGMFDAAVTLVHRHNETDLEPLQLEPVFTKLADKCVHLALQTDEAGTEWLALNDIDLHLCSSSSNAAWELLRALLLRYDNAKTNFSYHRCVVERILSLRPVGVNTQHVPLPVWLVRSYQAADASALLRLLLKYDQLADAVVLVSKFVDAHLGAPTRRKDQLALSRGEATQVSAAFGVKAPMHGTSAPLSSWLPFSAIDSLRQRLTSPRAGSDSLLRTLDERIGQYFSEADRASQILEEQEPLR